jgi:glutaconate CoA-transferase subunit A
VALIHAPRGDERGNLHLDKPYVLDEHFAYASREVVATVDRLVSTAEVEAAGITIPAHLVSTVTEVPFGAHPASCYPGYAYDRPHMKEYVDAATAGQEAADAYIARYVHGAPTEEAYRKLIGVDRLAALGGWTASTDAWKELFA